LAAPIVELFITFKEYTIGSVNSPKKCSNKYTETTVEVEFDAVLKKNTRNKATRDEFRSV
jgi:hypothetical protein